MEKCSSFWFLVGYILGFVFYYMQDNRASISRALLKIKNRFTGKPGNSDLQYYNERKRFDNKMQMMDELYKSILEEKEQRKKKK